MEWQFIAPLYALVGGALLGLSAVWYKLGRMENKLDMALKVMRDHTHADGSRATTPIPADAD